MSIQCDRCGRDVSEINLVDSPIPHDPTLYCLDCYAYLFPPGWTDEIPFSDPPEFDPWEFLSAQPYSGDDDPDGRGD